MPDTVTLGRIRDLGVPVKLVTTLAKIDRDRFYYCCEPKEGNFTPAERSRVAVTLAALERLKRELERL